MPSRLKKTLCAGWRQRSIKKGVGPQIGGENRLPRRSFVRVLPRPSVGGFVRNTRFMTCKFGEQCVVPLRDMHKRRAKPAPLGVLALVAALPERGGKLGGIRAEAVQNPDVFFLDQRL